MRVRAHLCFWLFLQGVGGDDILYVTAHTTSPYVASPRRFDIVVSVHLCVPPR